MGKQRRRDVETATVGQVIVPARIENLFDLKGVKEGRVAADQVRRIEVEDARVDTGASILSMPRHLIDQLRLERIETKTARTATGPAQFGIYEPVKLTIQRRDCEIRVTEVADNCPVLIGVI